MNSIVDSDYIQYGAFTDRHAPDCWFSALGSPSEIKCLCDIEAATQYIADSNIDLMDAIAAIPPEMLQPAPASIGPKETTEQIYVADPPPLVASPLSPLSPFSPVEPAHPPVLDNTSAASGFAPMAPQAPASTNPKKIEYIYILDSPELESPPTFSAVPSAPTYAPIPELTDSSSPSESSSGPPTPKASAVGPVRRPRQKVRSNPKYYRDRTYGTVASNDNGLARPAVRWPAANQEAPGAPTATSKPPPRRRAQAAKQTFAVPPATRTAPVHWFHPSALANFPADIQLPAFDPNWYHPSVTALLRNGTTRTQPKLNRGLRAQ